ncbi:hypothetical protein MKX03_032692, partial [Papaver bracteatum]
MKGVRRSPRVNPKSTEEDNSQQSNKDVATKRKRVNKQLLVYKEQDVVKRRKSSRNEEPE